VGTLLREASVTLAGRVGASPVELRAVLGESEDADALDFVGVCVVRGAC
jgi:hypothetical protein